MKRAACDSQPDGAAVRFPPAKLAFSDPAESDPGLSSFFHGRS
jgi:hypothetical protein